jgi:hypothetical protein
MKVFAKLLSITVYIIILNQHPSNAQGDCANAFKPVISLLKAKTNKEYLEKLKFVYESTSQKELEKRSRSAGGIKLPRHGSASFKANKGKVYNVYKGHQGQQDFDFSYQEQMALTSTYTQSAAFIGTVEAWQNCVSETYRIPFIYLIGHTKDSVFLKFKINTNDLERSNRKIKVTCVNVLNLKLVSSTIPSDSIVVTNSTYLLRFARPIAGEALVSIDLSDGVMHAKHIPAFASAPMFETQKEYGRLDFTIESNIYPGWLKVLNPDGTLQSVIEFPDEDNDYHIHFKVKTGSHNPDTRITSYQYINQSGAIRFQKPLGLKIEQDGTLSLAYYIVTGHVPVTGKLTVLYTVSKEVCVANCR